MFNSECTRKHLLVGFTHTQWRTHSASPDTLEEKGAQKEMKEGTGEERREGKEKMGREGGEKEREKIPRRQSIYVFPISSLASC